MPSSRGPSELDIRFSVAEGSLSELFHCFWGNPCQATFARLGFHALLDHGLHEVGDAFEARAGFLGPLDVKRLRRRVDSELADPYFRTAFRRIEAPFVGIQPVAVIGVGTRPAAPADVRVFALGTLALELGLAK